MVIINENVPLNNRMQNANIKCIASDEQLLKFGFTNRFKPKMYFCEGVGSEGSHITFNVSIDKETRDIVIDVIDETFLQPYDYQAILKRYKKPLPFALKIHNDIQKIMKKMVIEGIITGYNENDYI